MRQSLRKIADGEAVDHLETERLRKDGMRINVSVTLSPLRTEGRVVGISAIVTDITERKRTERELEQSVALLRQAADERRFLLRRLVSAVEEERARISGQLHDDTIQMMTAVGLRLEKLRGSVDPSLEPELEQLRETVSSSVGRLRRLMVELHPRTLDEEGITSALREHLTITNEGAWTYSLDGALSREPDEIMRHLAYRIALEALTNARKHSRADRIAVTLRDEGDGFAVTIHDDGIGVSAEQISEPAVGHVGLASMRERAETANGWFRIGPATDGGTAVEFWLPYEAQMELVDLREPS